MVHSEHKLATVAVSQMTWRLLSVVLQNVPFAHGPISGAVRGADRTRITPALELSVVLRGGGCGGGQPGTLSPKPARLRSQLTQERARIRFPLLLDFLA